MQAWPEFSVKEFANTSHLLHMGVQIVGKLMLTLPFEPHWANIAMPLTSRGVTTGAIPYKNGTFSFDFDFIDHRLLCTTSWGDQGSIQLASMSVAELYRKIFDLLKKYNIQIEINTHPQEVSNPISFPEDTASRIYDPVVVNAWWRIQLSTYRVLLTYHSQFYGITPKIGLFWGTLDLRDARYKGLHLPIGKEMSNYIARNAFDDAQFEVGWTASNEKYPAPSFFAFAYPKPQNYENAKIEPASAKWAPAINEFVLDYNDLRLAKDPDADLLAFFDSTYRAFAKLDNWDPQWTVKGRAI